ncbi:MAG: zf-HC2 domain-containing protein [Nitrospirae bacterium]|nr:zf-HC2 domain-containing protein [Nitrospirota bacterium]
MYDCSTILNIMHPYLDGELPTKEAILIQEHLDTCSSCRIKFQKEKELLTFYKSNLPREQAPHDLKVRLNELIKDKSPVSTVQKKWFKIFYPATIGVTVVLLGLILFNLKPSEVKLSHLVEEALEYHVSYQNKPFKLQFENSNPEKLRQLIKSRGGFDIHLSDPEVSKLNLIGANLQMIEGIPTVLIFYKDSEGKMITLMVSDYDSFVPFKGNPEEIQSLKFYNLNFQGNHITTWQNKPRSYVLISESRKDVGNGCHICHGGNKEMEPKIQSFIDRI